MKPFPKISHPAPGGNHKPIESWLPCCWLKLNSYLMLRQRPINFIGLIV